MPKLSLTEGSPLGEFSDAQHYFCPKQKRSEKKRKKKKKKKEEEKKEKEQRQAVTTAGREG